MKNVTRLLSTAALASLLAALMLPLSTTLSLATPYPCPTAVGCKISGAPGPIAGAGLPFLAVGYGVYWLVKRRRKAE
jgi:hypothetical protein